MLYWLAIGGGREVGLNREGEWEGPNKVMVEVLNLLCPVVPKPSDPDPFRTAAVEAAEFLQVNLYDGDETYVPEYEEGVVY